MSDRLCGRTRSHAGTAQDSGRLRCHRHFSVSDHSIQLVSTHPCVNVDQVVEATGFELHTGDVSVTREPTVEEMVVLERLDPKGLRHREVSV